MDEGYIVTGWARGQFESDKGDMVPYYNLYVVQPVSNFQSDDYVAEGYKAVKLKCTSADIWSGFKPGDRVKLFFDARGRVALMAHDDSEADN